MDSDTVVKLVTGAVGAAVLNGFTAWFGAKKANKHADRELLTVQGENGSSTIRKTLNQINDRLEGAESRIDKRFNALDASVVELKIDLNGLGGRVTKLEQHIKPKRSRKSV